MKQETRERSRSRLGVGGRVGRVVDVTAEARRISFLQQK